MQPRRAHGQEFHAEVSSNFHPEFVHGGANNARGAGANGIAGGLVLQAALMLVRELACLPDGGVEPLERLYRATKDARTAANANAAAAAAAAAAAQK